MNLNNKAANRTRTAVLVGGGLDSHAYMVLHKDTPQMAFVHVNYGQRVAEAEATAVMRLAEELGIVDKLLFVNCEENNHMEVVNEGVGVLFGSGPIDMDNAFVKGRNLFLIQKAIELGFGYVNLTLTQERGRMFLDADYAFVELVNNLMRRCYDVKVDAPYIREDKHVVMRRAYKRFPDFIDLSFTCWVGPVIECGTCPHCVKKQKIKEELSNPDNWPPSQTEEDWQRIKAGYRSAPPPKLNSPIQTYNSELYHSVENKEEDVG